MLIFIHVQGFYAAVEQADQLRYRGRPLVVGSDPDKGGSVTSASREARDLGIVRGMGHADALARAPGLAWLPTRLPRYRACAAEMRAILRGRAGRVEAAGLDGAYLEPPRGGDPLELAAGICVRLQAELGVRAVAGLGPTRFVAHLAALHSGPQGVRLIEADQAPAFLRELPVDLIWGLGPATAEKLAQHGFPRMADLQDRPLSELQAVVGRPAARFRALAQCRDEEPLRPSPPARSLSREFTLPQPTADLHTLGEALGELSRHLDEMLARERRVGRTVMLGIGYADGERASRTVTVQEPIAKQGEITELALGLLGRSQAGQREVRRLRLRVTRLASAAPADEARQLRLF